jgi:23S rRNA G2445 N2-methylase RlmL
VTSARYFAACTLGLEPALCGELDALGAQGVRPARGGAHFEGDLVLGYAANLWLRSAIRVQHVVGEGRARTERQLYDLVRRTDWSRFVHVDGTLAVDAAVKDSFLTHSGFAAQLVKDAIVDQFRQRTGRRPDVDTRRPDLPIKLLLRRDEVTLYRDLSGDSLHKRGYRPIQVKSPLNEATAAGLLLLSEWDRRSALLDPMCGSGTLVIEAALLSGDRAPGRRREFAFQRWPDFEARAWRALLDEADERARVGAASIPPIEGADRHEGALGLARLSARSAGVDSVVRFTHAAVAELVPAVPPRVVVTNPPYGERLGEGDDLEASWRDLGDLLRRCPGASAFVLSGDPALTRFLRLRASRKWPFRNGPIDCRFVRYDIDAERGSAPE